MKQSILLFLLTLLISGCSEKEIDPSFSLQEETGSITLASAANSQTVISFTSTREWEANTSSEWLLISPTSGEAGTYQLALTASNKNDSKDSRTAIVNLVSAGLTQSLTVTQSAADYVELERTTYYTEAQGGSLQVKFTTNLSGDKLVIYSTANWLTQSADSRTEQGYVVNLTALPNEDERERTANLYFCKTNGLEEELLNSVTIIQEGTNTSTSTDYSADKTVRILQRATEGNGLPIVLMGDGFLDTEIEDGTYDEVMNKAMENLFTEEPLKSLRNYFNIYSVTAVSRSNRFDGYNTAFGCQMADCTMVDVNQELKKYGFWLNKEGEVIHKRSKLVMGKIADNFKEAMFYNFRANKASEYSCSSESCAVALSAKFKIDREHITMSFDDIHNMQFYKKSVEESLNNHVDLENGLNVMRVGDKLFLIDDENKTIVDFDDLNLTTGYTKFTGDIIVEDEYSLIDAISSIIQGEDEHLSGGEINNELKKKRR